MTVTMTEPTPTELEGDHSMEKKQLLQGIITRVDKKIERKSGPYERRALGFLMEQHHFGEQSDQGSESFLSTICGVEDAESGRQVTIKILKAVCETANSEYRRRLSLAESSSDANETDFLRSVKSTFLDSLDKRLNRVQDPDNIEAVIFSGVPGNWIPNWVPNMV